MSKRTRAAELTEVTLQDIQRAVSGLPREIVLQALISYGGMVAAVMEQPEAAFMEACRKSHRSAVPAVAAALRQHGPEGKPMWTIVPRR